jgi:AcrR family transcriptional regulator
MPDGGITTTRERLLAVARDHYLDVGFASFSLREVARRVGVSAPAVYRHFDSKEALLREVCTAGFRVFSSYLLRALSEATPRARLGASAMQYLRFGLENPRDYRVLFMGAAEDFASLTKAGKDLDGESTYQFLVDRVTECMKGKHLRKGDPEEVAAIIWSHVHGLVSLRLSGHFARVGDDAAFARFYADAVEHLLTGLSK